MCVDVKGVRRVNKEKVLKICKKIIHCLMIVQIILAIIFIIKNINYIPGYGDTKEFLKISETLQIPSYRPFIYPYILNIVNKIANVVGINMTYIVYFIQNIISLFACAILIKTLKEIFKIKLDKKQIVLYTFFMFSIPLNIHFNMSIKCDSLATSFTILFICFLIKYINTEKYRFAVYSFITMFLASNIRSEKIYFLSVVLLGAVIVEFIMHIYNKKTMKLNIKKVGILFLILIMGIATTSLANSVFYIKEEEKSNTSTIFSYIYERVVGNTLPDIYEYLPEDIKQTISYEDAVASTADRNYYKIPYNTLVEQDGNFDRAWTIVKVAIRRNLPNIISNILGDFLKNITAPFYVVFNNSDDMYVYTLTRMEGEHYLYTDGYVLYFNILLVLIGMFVILNKENIKVKNKRGILVILFYILVSAGFFALLTAFNFHIRYVMPVYILEVAIVTVLLNNKKQVIEIEARKEH